jgi:threonine dehydrogenase-like Zn-dependent dehydrogenase
MVQASLIAGASTVVGVDQVERRRDRAASVGALSADSAGALLELTAGERPHVVLCTVAADRAARDAFEALRPDGRMVTVAGQPPAGGEERKWVSGSWGCDERHWPEVIGHLESRRFVLDDYVTHRFPLAEIEQAFSLREHDLERSFKVVVVID